MSQARRHHERLARRAIHAPDLCCACRRAALHARKPRIAGLIKPHRAGRLVNELKGLAGNIDALPQVARSSDPAADYLLALAEAGQADYLVTGDNSGLLREMSGSCPRSPG